MEDREALRAAAVVAEVAAEHADESERGRRLAAPVVAAFEASGLGGLVAPTVLGGTAAPPETLVRVIERIARSDASAAWCAGIGAGSNFLAALIDEAAARELFADVSKGGAGPFAPGGAAQVTDDGYRVTGRWPYSSNCQQAAVVGAGMIAFADGRPAEVRPDGGGPQIRLGMFSIDQLEVDETWDTTGMRGTGSHDLVGVDVELPRERACTLFDRRWPDDPLFRLRTFDVLGPCLAPVPLGIGRAALDVVAARAVADASLSPAMGPRPHIGDDPVAQVELGRAEARLRGSMALLVDALGASWGHAVAGDVPPRSATALIGVACSDALAAGREAVDTAVRLMGTAAVREGQPLERIRRDIDTAGAHIMFSPTVLAGLSRELAGIPTFAFPFLPPPGMPE